MRKPKQRKVITKEENHALAAKAVCDPRTLLKVWSGQAVRGLEGKVAIITGAGGGKVITKEENHALAAKAVCDPRTLLKVWSGQAVRGRAAERAREVLREAGLL
jgi:hypothetical protein